MVSYDLYIQNINGAPQSPPKYKHRADLTPSQEDNPDLYFTAAIREQIRQSIQIQGGCRVTDAQLLKMVQSWIQDIREGYRDTTLQIDLPPQQDTEIDRLRDSGYQEIPDLIPPDLAELQPLGGALPPLDF